MNHDEKLTASAEENAEETMSIIDRASEAGSKRSRSSRTSQSSRSSRSSRISVSIAAATARAPAEAARTRVQFVKKENAIKLDKIKLEMTHKLDKAKMEADLEVLHHEKEQAAALAQAEVLEAVVGGIEDCISSASFSVFT